MHHAEILIGHFREMVGNMGLRLAPTILQEDLQSSR